MVSQQSILAKDLVSEDRVLKAANDVNVVNATERLNGIKMVTFTCKNASLSK